jgi:flavin reductase (DIM6/NTAB) family NADH-FMN oxidoreductase RutF
MHPLRPIQVEQLIIRAYNLWQKQWLLLTSGDFSTGQYNCMTVAWGCLGQMWGFPVAQVVVRKQRYTYEFMEKYPTFTLCVFPKTLKQSLNVLGTRSGRDEDKIARVGFTPIASRVVAAPCFAQAELVIECQKLYWQEMAPENFMNQRIDRHYPQKDYHRFYYGNILAVSGSTTYEG